MNEWRNERTNLYLLNTRTTTIIAQVTHSEQDSKAQSNIHLGHCLYHLLPPKTPAHCRYSFRERQHSFKLSNIEFLQFKNSSINRCLFKFTWLHSALQSDVFSDFVHIVRLILHFILCNDSMFYYRTQYCNSVRMTCSIKRLLILSYLMALALTAAL